MIGVETVKPGQQRRQCRHGADRARPYSYVRRIHSAFTD
jgi:hypothetical protein